MNLEQLNRLLEQVAGTTGVPDVAYHEFHEGCLKPVLKTKTDVLGVEKWKSVHAQNPVRIEHDRLLSDMVRQPRSVTVQDVKNDKRSSEEFFSFGIDSILVVPVLHDEKVSGIVVVASIGKLHHFSDEEVRNVESLVENSRDVFQISLREEVNDFEHDGSDTEVLAIRRG